MRAAALIALENIRRASAQLERVDVLAEAHVLLKPPVLTEAESIDDATAAIEWCLTEGFERAILMLVSAKPQSPLGLLAMTEGCSAPGADFRPASLWPALEVLSRLSRSMRSRVRVHGLASNTPIGLRPTTCPACEQVVIGAIQHFNFTGADEGQLASGGTTARLRVSGPVGSGMRGNPGRTSRRTRTDSSMRSKGRRRSGEGRMSHVASLLSIEELPAEGLVRLLGKA